MFNFLGNLFGTTLFKNLVNHYSGSGWALVILGYLAKQGVIPEDIIDKVNGIPAVELTPSLCFVTGGYLIAHMHLVSLFKWLSNYQLNKMQNRLALDNVKLQCLQVEKQIKEVKDANN
ncbi:hypothetical protein ACFX5K_03720 [Rickettsiales bacterium LUAb2]